MTSAFRPGVIVKRAGSTHVYRVVLVRPRIGDGVPEALLELLGEGWCRVVTAPISRLELVQD